MRLFPLVLSLTTLLGCASAASDDTAVPAPAPELDVADDDLADDPDWTDGDLVFQASQGEQSRYVMLATGSRLTHVGLIDVRESGVYVVEAVQPVKVTTLQAFRDRYHDSRLAAKRVPGLTDAQRSAVVKKARAWVGRDYDRRFGWDDATLYCSELAWKAYDYAVDVQIAELGTFGDFALLDT
ncbi:MAG: hypothetical protein FJ090_21175, partial [Deltaproteobacteria bacterium]|nr:hypothetical protein [Deltaproteobacteria bacterium]